MRPHMEIASWAWAEGKPNEFWSSSGTTSAETQYGRGAWTRSLTRSFTMALRAKSTLRLERERALAPPGQDRDQAEVERGRAEDRDDRHGQEEPGERLEPEDEVDLPGHCGKMHRRTRKRRVPARRPKKERGSQSRRRTTRSATPARPASATSVPKPGARVGVAVALPVTVGAPVPDGGRGPGRDRARDVAAGGRGRRDVPAGLAGDGEGRGLRGPGVRRLHGHLVGVDLELRRVGREVERVPAAAAGLDRGLAREAGEPGGRRLVGRLERGRDDRDQEVVPDREVGRAAIRSWSPGRMSGATTVIEGSSTAKVSLV